MYVVYEAFDDNTAVLLDIGTYARKEFTEQELIRFINSGHDVLGASVSGQKLNYLNAYNCLSFAIEEEANEYIRDNNLSYQNKRCAMGYYWVFEKKNVTRHVDYYVCAWAGDLATYIAKEGGYTNYIDRAKSFNKREAGERAALMKKNSKTGKYWTTQRVVR